MPATSGIWLIGCQFTGSDEGSDCPCVLVGGERLKIVASRGLLELLARIACPDLPAHERNLSHARKTSYDKLQSS
jgi:hypothetical protein